MRRRSVTFGLLAVLGLFHARPAWACVCSEGGTLREDFQAAEAVFAGRVVGLTLEAVDRGDGKKEEVMVASLQVLRRWKGPSSELIKVATCGDQEFICTCGTDFTLGSHFLVFAVGSPLFTGSCQRTRGFSRVPTDPDLQWLGVEDLIRDLDDLAHVSRQGAR